MKGGQSLNHLQQKKKEQEEADWILKQNCHICQKPLSGPYGRTTLNCGTVWSCSKTHELEIQQIKKGESRCNVEPVVAIP